MITAEQEKFILEKARVPEHIPSLMVGISTAEPFLLKDFLFFAKEDWLIFIGYPLEGDFDERSFAQSFKAAIQEYRPARAWFIAPQILASFPRPVRAIEKDRYYRLDLKGFQMEKTLARGIKKAGENLNIEKSHSFSKAHETLNQEFLNRQELPPRIRELYLRIPAYLAHSPTSLLLSAWDRNHTLSAFHVLESAAPKFMVYVMGCFSREHYVAHASDLLFDQMIQDAVEGKKEYIHLGLGVNEGIRRFKIKWGGVPADEYVAGEISCQTIPGYSWLKSLVPRL